MAVSYHIYSNSGAGDAINYAAPLGTTTGLSFTTGALAFPGSWSFGVRAFNANGEEQNLDCQVTIALDAAGNDISNQPAAPVALLALPLAGGKIRVQWGYPQAPPPDGFHVYVGPGPPVYTTPAATVAYKAGRGGVWLADLTGLSDGSIYAIGVRAIKGSLEETNTITVLATADATGPTAVHSLIGTPTS